MADGHEVVNELIRDLNGNPHGCRLAERQSQSHRTLSGPGFFNIQMRSDGGAELSVEPLDSAHGRGLLGLFLA